MDRPTVYSGALPRSADFLALGQDAMVGLGFLAEATLGNGPVVDGFTLAPTSPASLEAVLSGGSIYEQENLEATQWSSLPANSTIIVKQGIALNPQALTFTAPTTVGYAQCFLVEASYLDTDTGSIVLPYYNAANPSVPYSGPGNAGTANNTVRQGAVAIQVKAGIAAPSGTQVVPSPDAGWAGLYVVTLAQGATSVTAGNIALYSGAPFVLAKLPAVPAAVQAGGWLYAGTTSNTANAFTANLLPAPATFPVGMRLRAKMSAAPTGASTFAINGTTFSIQRRAGAACVGGEWAAGDIVDFNVLSSSVLQIAGLTPSDCQAFAPYYGEDTGTADALVVTLSPSPVTLVEGTVVRVEKGAASNATTTPTLKIMNMASGTPQTFNLLKSSGVALAAGDLFGSSELEFILDQNGNLRRFGLTASDVLSTTVSSGVFPRTLPPSSIFWVRTDGSDSNNGSANTPQAAFATPTGAMNYVLANFAVSSQIVTIQLGIPGTYAAPLGVSYGNFIIQGSSTNPSGYILSGVGNATGGCVMLVSNGSLQLNGVTIQNTGSNYTLGAISGGNVTLNNTSFTTTGQSNSAAHLFAEPGGTITIQAGCSVAGSMGYALLASGGTITQGAVALSVIGTPTYSQRFAYATGIGQIKVVSGASISGAANGQKFGVDENSFIGSGGGGVNYFPGSTAGVSATGGEYV